MKTIGILDTHAQQSLLSILDIEEHHAPKMPSEYIGATTKPCGYTKTAPRDWTEKEIEWILHLKQQGWSMDEISRSVERTKVSISIKLKRIGKKEYNYNADHVQQKYDTNAAFLAQVQPQTILDMYAGLHSWYADHHSVESNDMNQASDADHHEKAEMLIHRLYYEGRKYDLIDLDPFGSAYDCFDLAIKMAKKAIIITYGEMGHKRYKRLDYVRRFYGIETMEDFTIERLIAETQRIASRSKKMLTPVYVRNWNSISRVYYTISDMKITDQWN